MSSGGGLAAAVEGEIEGYAVLPAAPDDAQPGPGQDPDGVRMPAAAPGRGSVNASSSSTTGPSPRSIATPATPAARNRPTIALIAAQSCAKLNRPATAPSPPSTQAT